MRKSKFTKTQQQAILAQHDAGSSVADLCREHQISSATFYKWRAKFVSVRPTHLAYVRPAPTDAAAAARFHSPDASAGASAHL